jgi:hypothetical protein
METRSDVWDRVKVLVNQRGELVFPSLSFLVFFDTPGNKSEGREVARFTRATVGSLGFEEEPTMLEIVEKIVGLGHAICEPADCPSLEEALDRKVRVHTLYCPMGLHPDYDDKSYIGVSTRELVIPQNSEIRLYSRTRPYIHLGDPRCRWPLDRWVVFRHHKDGTPIRLNLAGA